jgi:hypothetical protein
LTPSKALEIPTFSDKTKKSRRIREMHAAARFPQEEKELHFKCDAATCQLRWRLGGWRLGKEAGGWRLEAGEELLSFTGL